MQKIGFLSYFLSRKRIALPFLPPGIFRFERTVQSLRFSSGCKVHLFHLNDFSHSFPQIFPISRLESIVNKYYHHVSSYNRSRLVGLVLPLQFVVIAKIVINFIPKDWKEIFSLENVELP